MLACLDVYYRESTATAACVLFEKWTDSRAAAEFVRELHDVAPYEPGEFYRRELPSLLAVLAGVPHPPTVVIVDAYVWLDANGKRGLGAHLFDALGGRTAVVGVAKSAFAGAPAIPVLRGNSRSPLYVTAAGMPAGEAAAHVAEMSGEFRVPTLLTLVDRLSRR